MTAPDESTRGGPSPADEAVAAPPADALISSRGPEHAAEAATEEPDPPADDRRPEFPADARDVHGAPGATAASDDSDREFPANAAETVGDGAGDDAPPEDPLTAAQRERDEYLDALQRKQAEFENFRRRTRSEATVQRILGHAEVAERMLDVLDDFDRTLAAADDVDPGFLKGVELVHDKLAGVLKDFGLERIEEAGAAFDPNRHEAVQQRPAAGDVEEPLVAEVLRPGYELGGRVLRAAMVVVEQ